MFTFFSILFILLGINAILLIFSINSVSEKLKKPLQKLSESSIPQLYSKQYSDREYKEAV